MSRVLEGGEAEIADPDPAVFLKSSDLGSLMGRIGSSLNPSHEKYPKFQIKKKKKIPIRTCLNLPPRPNTI